MKRCPQCDFIYEDDQSLCDMDGVLLVLDSRVLPNMHALATVDVQAAPKAHWRHRTFPAMAALILATVFSLVYFVSTTRTAPAPVPISGASVAAPVAAEPALAPEPSQQASDSNPAVIPAVEELNSSTATKEEEKKPNSAKASMTPLTKKASAPTTQRKPAEEKKEENKVNSILKKTGRILKKPFKF